jgi:threonine dehydratase
LRWPTGFAAADDAAGAGKSGRDSGNIEDRVNKSIHHLSISLADVQAARERLRGSIYYSPCAHSQVLSAQTGQQIYLKLENLQMTGSFKERGALNRITTLSPEQAKRGVVAASAGNHAQGVAYHATKRGIRALIVMPLATPLVKVTATRGFGAEVVLHGANYDEACDEALRICTAEEMTFIHPFDDPLVMAGQGTIGLELLEQVPELQAVAVPIGGGGLIGGIACAIKESRPEIRVIGVQTSRLPSMAAAIEQHGPVTLESATTIADGIAVRRAGDVTFPVVEKYVDEIVTVDEDEVASAILVLLEREKTLAEGAGATALAALIQKKTTLTDERTAVIVSAGNIDVTLLSRIIERGLVQDGRMIRLRIHLLDKPGALAELTRLIASHRVNIVDTLYNRAYYGVNLGNTAIDITLETRGREQVAELLAALTSEGYLHSRVL